MNMVKTVNLINRVKKVILMKKVNKMKSSKIVITMNTEITSKKVKKMN